VSQTKSVVAAVVAATSAFLLFQATLVGGAVSSAGASAAPSCNSITKSQAVAAGFKMATGPKITPYNNQNLSANAANALGETIDFGAKAIVVSCVSPTDLKALSVAAQGPNKPVMTATQYLHYLVKTSGGSMKQQAIARITNYVDFGNGKEDGLGSNATAYGVRLDSFVAGHFIVLIQTVPASPKPSKNLATFAKTIVADLSHQ
jgi:hypothetical protein